MLFRSVNACAIAASVVGSRPPSENESGVTLTIPRTYGRDQSQSTSPSRRGARAVMFGAVELPQPHRPRRETRVKIWRQRLGTAPHEVVTTSPVPDVSCGVDPPRRDWATTSSGRLAANARASAIWSQTIAGLYLVLTLDPRRENDRLQTEAR